jgi:hypothetical protein
LEERITLNLDPDDYPPPKGWALVEWCLHRGAEEFTINVIGILPELTRFCQAFEEEFAPFHRESAPRELTVWHGRCPIQTTPLWTLNPASLYKLRSALTEGIFGFETTGKDAWFEDLILYRDSGLMLGVVTHEEFGLLRVTPGEKEELDGMGFRYELGEA